MIAKPFDVILTKDGRKGTVLDMFNAGEAYDVEMDPGPTSSDIQTVYASEIERVLLPYPWEDDSYMDGLNHWV